jgi:GT2 family glycosyltransferase
MIMKRVTVTIVIPNWNGKHLLEKHLPGVLRAAKGAPVIVADDASTDGSVPYVRTNFPNVRVVTKRKQQGFAGTVNAGVAHAKSDIVVLLNTDVEPDPGFLEPLLPHFADPTVFAVGCLEKSEEGGTIVLRGRGEAMWQKGFFVHWRGDVDKTGTAWVSGGSGAFRKKVWDTLGGMDTLFNPFYWEDIDLSYRAYKAGYRLVFEPKSVVGHYHEEGKIRREYTPQEVKRIAFRNQFFFIWKNLSQPRFMAEHVFWLPIRLIGAIFRGDFPMVLGFAAACVQLPGVVQSRVEAKRRWRRTDPQYLP